MTEKTERSEPIIKEQIRNAVGSDMIMKRIDITLTKAVKGKTKEVQESKRSNYKTIQPRESQIGCSDRDKN